MSVMLVMLVAEIKGLPLAAFLNAATAEAQRLAESVAQKLALQRGLRFT